MSNQVINIGTNANDGTGDPLRVAAEKINGNFSELYEFSNTFFSSSNTANVGFVQANGGYSVANAGFTMANAAFTLANTCVRVVSPPTTAIGRLTDVKGYVAFDPSYHYYCSNNYTGNSNVWVRSAWSGVTW